MPIVKIRGHDVDIDIEAELRAYDWIRPRWQSDKLIAASPFRYDNTPSFFVRLEPFADLPAGTWHDSGAYDPDWRSGNFVKLMAFLRGESYDETADYLLGEYGRLELGNELTLPAPKLRLASAPLPTLPADIITQATSGYLLSRGIGAETQALYGVGYGKQAGFTALPWRLPNGEIATVMYRATRGKLFFYESDGWPRRRLIYGIDVIARLGARRAALCEAPIDALSWREGTGGEITGIATGGVTLSDEQADMIKRSSIEEVILAGDNDKPGAEFNAEAERKLRGHVRLLRADYGAAKDANDVLRQAGGEGLRQIAEQATYVREITYFTAR